MGWKAATRLRNDPAKRKRRRAAKKEAKARGALGMTPKQHVMSASQRDHASNPRARRLKREGAKRLGMEE